MISNVDKVRSSLGRWAQVMLVAPSTELSNRCRISSMEPAVDKIGL